MSLQLFLKTEHRDLYENHKSAYEGDCGIDLFFPKDITILPRQTLLIDLEICCEMRLLKTSFIAGDQSFYTNTSYFVYPRSSIYKTPLRMANSVGIIDSKYRNSIKVAVDNISNDNYHISRGDRLFQICSDSLKEMKLCLTDNLSSSNRGEGFGSSGSNIIRPKVVKQ